MCTRWSEDPNEFLAGRYDTEAELLPSSSASAGCHRLYWTKAAAGSIPHLRVPISLQAYVDELAHGASD